MGAGHLLDRWGGTGGSSEAGERSIVCRSGRVIKSRMVSPESVKARPLQVHKVFRLQRRCQACATSGKLLHPPCLSSTSRRTWLRRLAPHGRCPVWLAVCGTASMSRPSSVRPRWCGVGSEGSRAEYGDCVLRIGFANMSALESDFPVVTLKSVLCSLEHFFPVEDAAARAAVAHELLPCLPVAG